MLRGDERDDGVLLRELGLERVHAGALRGRGLLLTARRAAILQRRTQMLEGLTLPEIEQRRLDLVLVAEIRHRHAIDEMPPEDGCFILRRELPPLSLLAVRFAHRLLHGPRSEEH